MNHIDQKFYKLIRHLNKQTKEELFHQMKDHYLGLSKELKQSFEDYFEKFPYWGTLKEDQNEFEHIKQKVDTFTNHLEDLFWLYHRLEDYRSKQLLFAILNNWYQYDFSTLHDSLEYNYHPYFDLDIIPMAEKEVLVDLGAYTGDNILDYLDLYGSESYQKIYAYDITDETFKQLKKNLAFYPNIICKKKAVLDENKMVSFKESNVDASANMIEEEGTNKIEAVTLDHDIQEPISMLKMDIEGSEQRALIGARKHIKNDAPKLLLSVYHSFEDLWKIPKMIEEMKPGYHFYLRSHGGYIFPTEITLLAIYDKKTDE